MIQRHVQTPCHISHIVYALVFTIEPDNGMNNRQACQDCIRYDLLCNIIRISLGSSLHPNGVQMLSKESVSSLLTVISGLNRIGSRTS